MIAPCQSANERTLLLFIEITLAIDGGAVITPFVTTSPDLVSHITYVFLSVLSC